MHHPLQSLRWRCRRGNRELDLLLSGYLDQQLDTATDREKQAFIELLEKSDSDLWGCITGLRKPENSHQELLLEKIRALVPVRP